MIPMGHHQRDLTPRGVPTRMSPGHGVTTLSPLEVSPCPQRVTPSPASLTLSPKADVPGAADVLRWAAATPKCQPAPKGRPQRVTPSPGGDIVPSVTGSDPKGALVPKGGGDPIPAVGAAIPPLSGCSQGLRCWGGGLCLGGGNSIFFFVYFSPFGGFLVFSPSEKCNKWGGSGGATRGLLPPPFFPHGVLAKAAFYQSGAAVGCCASRVGSVGWPHPISMSHPISVSPSHIHVPILYPHPTSMSPTPQTSPPPHGDTGAVRPVRPPATTASFFHPIKAHFWFGHTHRFIGVSPPPHGHPIMSPWCPPPLHCTSWAPTVAPLGTVLSGG